MSEAELMGVEVKPLGDRLLLKPLDSTKEKSGLIIPDSAKEKPQEGTIIAVGTTVKDLTIGDRVLYGKYSGTEIKVNGFEHILLNKDDILAVII